MKVDAIILGPTTSIPNSELPLLIMCGAIPADEAASEKVERRFARHGWQGTWTYTVFDYWHFHVEGHEVLACVSGEASIGFGGDEADGGVVVPMTPGDAVIVPAGVGHKRIEATKDFQVVGGYPPAQNGSVVRADSMDVGKARQKTSGISDPRTDPGDGGAFRWSGTVL